MTINQKIAAVRRHAERDEDLAEFNAGFERLRVASGPHLPIVLHSDDFAAPALTDYRVRMQAAIDRFWQTVGR